MFENCPRTEFILQFQGAEIRFFWQTARVQLFFFIEESVKFPQCSDVLKFYTHFLKIFQEKYL